MVTRSTSDCHGSSAKTRRPPWIWLGVVVIGVGFALIAVAWGQVAAEREVYRQVPYVLSAGLVGLGLIMIGLTVLNIASRYRDASDRERQIAKLVRTLEELQDIVIDDRGSPR